MEHFNNMSTVTTSAPAKSSKSASKTDATPAVAPVKMKTAMEILAELRAKQKADADAVEAQIKALEEQAKKENEERLTLIQSALSDVVKELNDAGIPYTLALLSTHAREMANNEGKLRPVSLGRTVSDGTRANLSDEERKAKQAQLPALLTAGKTAGEIASILGVSIPTVNNWKAQAGLTKARA